MKKLIFAALGVAAFGAEAVNVTVQNFDEDLATVYVNGTATTNGQVVAVDGNVTLELKDFRNDYYFRFAPACQTDRSMALESWEGVPSGYETQNPATFTPEGDYTVTPNVDVKGYCWSVETIGDVQQITNHLHRFRWGSVAAATRQIYPNACITNQVGATENNLVLDFIERVRYEGKNYTITRFASNGNKFNYSRVGTWAISPRFNKFTDSMMKDIKQCFVTNMVGAYDVKSVECACSFYSFADFRCPATNCVPRRTTSIGSWCGYLDHAKMTGELLLETIQSISSHAFGRCKKLTAARLTSPYLTTIESSFYGCTLLKEFTFGSTLSGTVSTAVFDKDSVTNIVFLAEAPSVTSLDNLLTPITARDGRHDCKLTVDAGRASWWSRVTMPSTAEVEAGLPANCMGVYVDAAGGHRTWIVSSNSLNGVLLVGDMTMQGMDGFVPRTGLESGEKVTLTAPEGYDRCELQKLVGGNVWTTYQTVVASSFEYSHAGEIVRAVWKVDGATLTTTANYYGGSIAVELLSGREISSGIYQKGSVVRLTASGNTATHPTSHFAAWTAGVAAESAASAVVELTLAADTSVVAEFAPDEWVYTASTGKMTDGEWTCGVSLGGTNVTVTSVADGQNGALWLDLSLPVRNAADADAVYEVTCCTFTYNNYIQKLRVGPHHASFAGDAFRGTTKLARLDGLGASAVTTLPANFMYESSSPLANEIYEASDYMPRGVTTFMSRCYVGGPYLTGTLSLPNVATFSSAWADVAGVVFGGHDSLRYRLYHDTTAEGRVVGVTNLLLTCEGLSVFPYDLFDYARLESVTIASTNLTTATVQAFTASAASLKEMIFLAHAPAAAAFDNLVKAANNTNMVVYCSKHAPGWKALRASGYRAFAEWPARPAGAWGMYQTLDGQKRYYLVQKDSKYDHRDGFMMIVE